MSCGGCSWVPIIQTGYEVFVSSVDYSIHRVVGRTPVVGGCLKDVTSTQPRVEGHLCATWYYVFMYLCHL